MSGQQRQENIILQAVCVWIVVLATSMLHRKLARL